MIYDKTLVEEAAAAYSVPALSIHAVMDVEAPDSGFLADGRPKILFEAHYFRARTNGEYDESNPTISAPYPQSRQFYLGGAAEYDRLAEAKALNGWAALESASWGSGQVMGANWKSLGYDNVQAFVDSMKTAAGQLDAMMRYCKVNGLLRHMRNFPDMDACRAFAAGYNGTGAVDEYAPKIAEAYMRHSKGQVPARAKRSLKLGSNGEDVKELQRLLGGLVADGDFGPKTDAAVRQFQNENGLVVDGIVGPKTLSLLRKKGAV